MVKVPISSDHIILAELHTGMLVLAGLCILAIALVTFVPGLKKIGPRALALLDPTSYVAATAGTIMFVIGGSVGLLIGPLGPLLTIPAAENKVMFAIFALNLWLVVVVMRAKFGSRIWNTRGLSAMYTLVTIAGMGFLTITGCESAHITGTVSPFDPLWELLGLDLSRTLVVFPVLVSYIIIGAMVAITVAAVLLLRWRKR
jgi:hypothetical protein